MKKFIYSFLAVFCLFLTATRAQTNPCAGKANFQLTINVNTVSFVSINTSNIVLEHYWKFGDGTSSNAVNPVHQYQLPGNYRVVHYIKDVARNCYDSAVKEFQLNFTPSCELLQPKFEWERDAANPNRIKFFNQSLPNAPPTVLLYKWSFGDGTYSTEKNPVHIYNAPGQYNVCLTIRYANSNCEKTLCIVVTIPAPCNLQPNFAWAADPVNPLKLKFTNQTVVPANTAQAKWSFGDGTTSTEWSPTHLYAHPGIYTVCLKVYINNICVKEICKQVVVRDCNIEPNFIWAADPANPLKLKFTNQTVVSSINAQAKWSFGDGTTSTEWNPTHLYTQPGIYTVCLKVYISNICVKEICKQVVVRACNIEPNFAWTIDDVFPLRGVKFHNQTALISNALPLSVKWNFGDGTGSNEWSPFHDYQQPGTYKVCLRIEFFPGCVKEICKEVTIPAPVNCERLSSFKMERIPNEPNAFVFKADFVSTTLKYTWTFGDGTGALGSNARHKYDRPGRYIVCLTVYRAENCASTTCKEIVVGPLNCEQTYVKFEYQRLNPPIGNAIKFTAVSNQTIVAQRWTIQKSNGTIPVIINASNPTYIFQDTGTYKVCLRAETSNDCVKEYCEVIRIYHVPNTCTMQIMPNPAVTTINFKLQVETQQIVTASIIDITGVRKAVFYLNATVGLNTFTLPVAVLPAGYYTLEVKVGNRICHGRFQKVN